MRDNRPTASTGAYHALHLLLSITPDTSAMDVVIQHEKFETDDVATGMISQSSVRNEDEMLDDSVRFETADAEPSDSPLLVLAPEVRQKRHNLRRLF